MTVVLNGESREVKASRSVTDIVAEFALPAASLLIEHNGTALTRSEWPNTSLGEGDRIELLYVTAGG